ncbi:G/U mismatch-specific uracil-DNA glycosylase [Rhizobiales bacterium GAS191]|jgi:TDG/mug DNA glycosylase family protein|nr:G/U mismatch-specific uracil-DNA glycosylase [Rhizobiales bacterium GAS113]SED96972.1 G/U mismatch-specific uracil-DNA glycosylase [Rhizobiales bacterium GAS191]SEE51429.1 G/U mismatch-specific uracil-DNA glycosylase [Rhizobiales bacterium GAS188]
MADRREASFDAMADEATRVLILGSLPGAVSLSRRQYYAHPSNQFWRLMEAVIGRDLVRLAYPERKAVLISAGIGLWDVIQSAERVGSLDSNIRYEKPNTLGEFVATLPALRAVCFNGAKASNIGRKQLAADSALTLISLPSSSAAHATMPFERKRQEWLRLNSFLGAAR